MKRRELLIGTVLGSAAIAMPGFAQQASSAWTREWPNTDFSKSSVALDEIISGGVPKDGIPSLPSVEMAELDVASHIDPREPVFTMELDGERARTYPLRYLTWHEIANDVIGDTPVLVSFCPLCNSAHAFERTVNGQVLDFGVSGKLRFSNLIMFDRQTESWWQQFTGTGIVGEMNNVKMVTIPGWTEPMGEYRERRPDGLVMAEPTSARRPYGRNPYRGYDTSGWPFLYRGEAPSNGVDPMAMVVRVGATAWPLARFEGADEITEDGYRIVWEGGMASALDSGVIAKGRDIGSIRVFDAATGDAVVHEVIFAFVFQAFEPDGTWRLGDA